MASQVIPGRQIACRGMLVFAVLGIAVNGFAALRLRNRRSLSAKVAAWHLIEDVFGWIAVLVVAIALLVVDLQVLDPLLSIAITAYILYNVLRNLRQTFMLFLQAVPEDIDLAELQQSFSASSAYYPMCGRWIARTTS